MQLNAVGLVGFLIVLNLINSVGFDFFFGTCLVVLNNNEITRCASAPRLIRKNPLVTHTDKEFKKDFRFSKSDIPRLLRVLHWPPVMYTVNQVVYTSEVCLMVLCSFKAPVSSINLWKITFQSLSFSTP